MKTKYSWTTELLKILGMAVVVFLPVFFLCLYIRFFPMNYGDDELPYYLWNSDVTNQNDTRYYSTLILGDSSANAAYLPELLSEGTISLALGGTTPLENFHVLENWLANHEAPNSIFLSFMDYHLVYDNMFYERTVYSHLLTPAQERQIVHDAFAIGEDYIAQDDAYLQLFEYDHCFPNKYMPSLLNAGFTERNAQNEERYAAVSLHRGAYIGMTTDFYTETKPNVYESFAVNPIFDDYMKRLLNLAKENGITVYITSLPKPDNAVLTEVYRNQRDEYYKSLVNAYDNTVYYAAENTVSGAYFHDWEHFNLYGARYWSQFIQKRYPEAFVQEETSAETKLGILDYLQNAETPDGLLGFADGKTYAAVVIAGDAGDWAADLDDTGLAVKQRKVFIKKHSDINVTVQEANSSPNGFCIWMEPDGACAIVSGDTVYGVEINDSAGLTVLIVDTETHMPVIVRNYIRTSAGWSGQ